MINLRFSDPQHKIEMHQELEEIARMWESLAASALTLELPVIESPALSATENSGPMIREPCNITSDTKTSNTQFVTPSYRRNGSKASGRIRNSEHRIDG